MTLIQHSASLPIINSGPCGLPADDSPEVPLKMIQPNVKIDMNVELLPFGQATVAAEFAHPDHFATSDAEAGAVVTPVMPLGSSVITPGHSRPVSA